MDIEAVAHDTPEKVINFDIDPATGFMPHHGRALAKALGLEGDLAKQANKLGRTLYNGFLAKDMAMLEINPLIVTEDGRLHCLDAKISFCLFGIFLGDVAKLLHVFVTVKRVFIKADFRVQAM